MPGFLMPAPRFAPMDLAGDPIPGGLVHTYASGTTTPLPTYFNADLAAIHANTNPVVLDAAGRCVIFLPPGVTYTIALETALGVPVWSQDDVSSGPFFNGTDVLGTAGETLTAGKVVYLSDGSGGKTPGRWYLADSANNYSSTSPTIGMVQFTIASGTAGVIRTGGTVTGLAGLVAGTTYYVGSGGALTSTPPALARVVGVADTTTSIILYANPARLATNVPITQSTVLTGAQNNFALTPGVGILYLDGANIGITGFTAGIDGQRVVVINRGAGPAPSSVQNQGATSSAANRVITLAGSTVPGFLTYLAFGAGVFEMEYDAGAARWRMITHDSGWITPGYVAGDFLGNGAMTWTVDAGDVITSRFRVTGRTVTYSFSFATTTIGGVANTNLRIASPQWGDGIIAAFVYHNALAFANDGAVRAAYVRAPASGSALELTTTAATAWTLVVNAGYFAGEIVFEVI